MIKYRYRLKFPLNADVESRVTIIRILRDLQPGLGLKEAKDMVASGITTEVDIVDNSGNLLLHPHLELRLQTLQSHGVQVTHISRGLNSTPVTDTSIAELQALTERVLARKEYDRAKSLIELIQVFSEYEH